MKALTEVAGALAAAGIPVAVAEGRGAPPGPGAARVDAVAHRSTAVRRGTLFCCVPGGRADGHDFAPAAVEAGAAALLVERHLDLPVPQLVVPSVRAAMGVAASVVLDDPSRALAVVGVTGTNGKTTTVSLLRDVLRAAGRRCEALGTLHPVPGGPPTTPDAPELQAALAAWRDEGVEAVAMEVSSHALQLGRVEGTWFAVAVFTMLGVDHLDLHGSVEAYFEAKASLFTPRRTRRAVIRADDPWGAQLVARARAAGLEVRTYELDDAAGRTATLAGSRFEWRGRTVELPLAGAHNVANALAAATTAEWLGVGPDAVAAGLSGASGVAGRFELVDAGQPFTVAVDYAHTPDGLATALTAARERASSTGGRVLVVFGCGGDRDVTKRPEMGRVAAEGADVVVITSDNPRSEDPQAIIDDVLHGIPPHPTLHVEPDRARAIRHSLRAARQGDVVLLAGKGHETQQVFADRTVPFDDRDVARRALAELGHPGPGGGGPQR